MIPGAAGTVLWLVSGSLFYSSACLAVPQDGTPARVVDPNEERQYSLPDFHHNPDPTRLFLSPEIEISGFEGELLTSTDLRGQVVLFEFWWSGCVYGVGPVSYLKSLTRELVDQPSLLISINTDGDTGEMRLYMKKYNMDWPQYRNSARLRAARRATN